MSIGRTTHFGNSSTKMVVGSMTRLHSLFRVGAVQQRLIDDGTAS
jgi:hypothetical protein